MLSGKTTVVYRSDWHQGVVGIVASRLTDSYYRPTIVLTKTNGMITGSARSVKDYDIYDAIDSCSDLLEHFGGHKYAAGLTLLEDQFDGFKNQFEKVVSATIDPQLLIPEIKIDGRIGLQQINAKLLRILKQFAPFGPGNMTPVFMAEKLKDTGYAKGVGEDEKHLKCSVSQPNSVSSSAVERSFGAIGFNLGNKLSYVKNGDPFSAVFAIEENEWNGNVSLQLKLKDIK